jgi:predicted DNA-binding ribbon-helix-helix protein
VGERAIAQPVIDLSSWGLDMAEEEGGGLLKRSLTIKGHRTSIALEQQFWEELERLARLRNKSMPMLIAEVDERRAIEAPDASLASSLRVFALLNRTPRS